MSHTSLTVEVAYARKDKQKIVVLQVAPGTTAGQAVVVSGILREFPEIDFPVCKLGIFGKHAAHETPLGTGDRVEIYRPLIADPKEIRRKRAASSGTTKKVRGPG